MARRTTKKQPEAHKIDCVEVFAALRDLEKTKGIPVDYMVERMKQGMANAYRKDREDRRDVPADNVVVDFQESGLSVHVVKTVVEELEDTALEIHIDAARNTVTLGTHDDLYARDVYAQNFRIRDIEWLKESPDVQARIRYKSPSIKGKLSISEEALCMHFEEPVWGVTPGQSLVIYKDGLVIGGGFIYLP